MATQHQKDSDSQPEQLRVFLCHASDDKPAVRELYQRLRHEGMAPWLDEEDLLPGQNWGEEIPKAVRASNIVIVCLSHNAITKTGYVQKEIRYALDVADEQPQGATFVIPLRLEQCQVPERLAHWHWVDLFEGHGYERLVRALTVQAHTLGINLKPSWEQLHRASTRIAFFSMEIAVAPEIPTYAGGLGIFAGDSPADCGR